MRMYSRIVKQLKQHLKVITTIITSNVISMLVSLELHLSVSNIIVLSRIIAKIDQMFWTNLYFPKRNILFPLL